MAFFDINNVRIAGFSAGVPAKIYKTKEEGILSDKYSNDSYSKSTGVFERRYSEKLTAADLGFYATKQLLADLQWNSKDIDAIVFVTQTPDFIAPATACILQDKLGMSKECYAMDISLGCSGWVYGLSSIACLVSCGMMKKAILIAGDARQWHNFGVDALFGSATTITALEYKVGETFKFHCGTDGSGWDALYVPDGGAKNPISEKSFELENVDGKMISRLQSHMLGMDVFSFGITTAPKSVRKLIEHNNIDEKTIDYYIFHQANKLMIDTIKKKLKLDDYKVPLCLNDFGNTSSASIPLTIVTRLKDKILKDLHLLCCGFGIGLSWGTVYLKLDKNVVISNLVEVSDEL